MPTVFRLVNAVSEQVASPTVFQPLIDIIIQNLSANVLYVGSDQNVTAANGIQIPANGQWVDDKRAEDVWIIATGAASDVRIHYSLYKAGDR